MCIVYCHTIGNSLLYGPPPHCAANHRNKFSIPLACSIKHDTIYWQTGQEWLAYAGDLLARVQQVREGRHQCSGSLWARTGPWSQRDASGVQPRHTSVAVVVDARAPTIRSGSRVPGELAGKLAAKCNAAALLSLCYHHPGTTGCCLDTKFLISCLRAWQHSYLHPISNQPPIGCSCASSSCVRAC